MQLITKNKTYEIELTFEAAESPIVEQVYDFFSGAYVMKSIAVDKPDGELTENDITKNQIAKIDAMISGASSVPKMAIDFLYMGLLEHHGAEGDGTVLSRADAKKVYKEFCKENPDDKMAMHSGLFEALKVQMETDGFFKRIGLDQMLESMNKSIEEEVKQQKVPQDHKKKAKA